MSTSSALFIFLFKTLFMPALYIAGVFFIPSSIIFCPRADLKNLDLMVIPDFSRFPINPTCLYHLCLRRAIVLFRATCTFGGRLLLALFHIVHKKFGRVTFLETALFLNKI